MFTKKRVISFLLIMAMVLAMVPMTVFAADTTRLYCSAPSGWTKCYIYWWASSDTNPSWPGVAMTKGDDGIWYYDVPADAPNVIFNNGSGTQSADLAMPTDENVQFNYTAKTWTTYGGVVEEPEITYVTVYVAAPTSWGTPNAYWWGSSVENSGTWPGNAMELYEGSVYSVSIPSDATGLVFNGTGGQTADLTVPADSNVMWDVASGSWGALEVKEPVEVTYSYVVAGSSALCGTEWDTTDTNNVLTENDGAVSITYSAVAAGSYEFKVVKIGSDGSTIWYGNGEANATFTVEEACDVTITMTVADNVITVEGIGLSEDELPDLPVIPVDVVYYLRGTMNEWGLDNEMTRQENGTYVTAIDLAAGTYTYKAAVEDWTWSCPGQDATVVVNSDCKVTFILDVENYTVTAVGDGVEVVTYDYYVAGSAGLCGVEWDPAANQMTLNQETGLYEITFSDIAVGEYAFKITTGSWDTPSYGVNGNDYALYVRVAGDVKVAFNATTGEISVETATCDHSYKSVVTYPTTDANGYTTFTCEGCGDSYVENYTFPDVPSTLWSYSAIEFAVAKGYFTGYKSGNFGPTNNITRQDFVVVLARIAKVDLSQYSGRTSFSDVKPGDYYEKAVKWASSNGIVNGYKNGKFGVGDQITREQMVTILYNYAKKCGYDVSVPDTAKAKLANYTDAGKITGYAQPAVIWALHKGVISGMTATTIAPQNPASRGQAATILMNICKKNILPF